MQSCQYKRISVQRYVGDASPAATYPTECLPAYMQIGKLQCSIAYDKGDTLTYTCRRGLISSYQHALNQRGEELIHRSDVGRGGWLCVIKHVTLRAGTKLFDQKE
ncbi:hypothetical protein EVAR_77221_1 [Eumeta japonica]|uniref:Sushi domain-containing protein n=1 Tax=Eumeta variegata TaxID=151549 RepID=A0A4C1T228_EUMVA|nr:hypothetical protein EVAR_77221_1 [Eumeta japonica]